MVPSHIGPSKGIDAVSVLTVYVCLLLGVPAIMVVGPLGTAGSPATILAIAAFFWWAWFHIQRNRPLYSGFQPVRTAMVAWLIVMLLVYAHAMSSALPGDEHLPADSGMLRLVALSGVVLIANDGIPSLQRHRTIVRRLVLGVGIVALLGLVQHATKQLYVDRISIPGLTSAADSLMLAQRSGLVRPSGTSTHPIEYGVVLTTVLPLVVAFARKSPTRRWLYRGLLGAISFAIFLSISRSAIVCGVVAVCVLSLSWSTAARLRALAFTVTIAVLVYLTVPGTLGTITRLFTGISDDASVQSRTGSYDIAGQFISRSPVLGRGFGTFLPKYWILDNGYLGLLIEGGVVGFTGLLALIVVAGYAARRAGRAATDDFDREIARSLFASIAAGASGLAFFDTFAFPQSAGCFFLVLGVSGAALRLTRASVASRQPRPAYSGST